MSDVFERAQGCILSILDALRPRIKEIERFKFKKRESASILALCAQPHQTKPIESKEPNDKTGGDDNDDDQQRNDHEDDQRSCSCH
eukprot:scaffold50498_cov57-Cyclotella_meneghiniana.AAC.1